MARERFVTRTVKAYKVTAMTVNPKTAEIQHEEFTFGADFDKSKALEMLRKNYENTERSIVMAENIAESEKLYGMTETDFCFYGEVLPPRGEGGRTRERKVTRTVSSYAVTVLAVNLADRDCYERVYNMDINYPHDKPEKALATIRATWETSRTRIAAILKTEKAEQLYGMSEIEFMKHAVEMPARSTDEN